ncbi:MAG: signal recognition particle-docking protein FtsY [Actinobacteria bacterium]|nr:signal recognition particle-docking protein FtsY [Actinomycetota bacterium]
MKWFRRQEKHGEAEELEAIEVDEAARAAEEATDEAAEIEPEVLEEADVEPEDVFEEESDQEDVSWFARLKKGLSKSRENIVGKISTLLTMHGKIDEELWDEIESILIQADLGIHSTMRVIDSVRDIVERERISDAGEVMGLLKSELTRILKTEAPQTLDHAAGRRIYLIVGVNGTGKTTTIAKLARSFVKEGRSVLLGAADTFRAAAVEQLDIWAKRMGVDIVKHERGADPAAVVYDAIHAAAARRTDVLLIDTAGRLHTYVNLMEELKKIKRIAEREKGDADLRTLLVIDATTGQNGIAQARLFDEALDVDGIVLTKLDGTAKGGIILAIHDELAIPIRYVGVGEGMDDLKDFNADEFIEALIGS